ncbi:hypothetical protein GCK32_022258 [Trichostrongylus colubriformis]|uniref:Uncharacterized protein n=1 Tax=Trichostrongylus colubriformis TaxID=6319 RepID=A0AAN8FH38_TRICO
MLTMGRLALHKHTKIQTRRKRYSQSHTSQPISCLLDNQLFHTKVGILHLFYFPAKLPTLTF